MGSGCNLFGVLLWISMLYFAGMYLFTKGFLLTRVEIAESSVNPCASNAGASAEQKGRTGGKTAASASCPTTSAPFKRALIIIIDALRYDFAAFNESLTVTEELPFQNKMPIFSKTIKERPEQSVLFRSMADPPTTTLQRLKGMVTGSLPTFVDAGSNFASHEISEDNIVDQLVGSGKRVVFMGDDTWTTLFQNKFHRSFPFPSFNVKDLHTVDEGVISHLLPEMRKKDWDVIIAHFLGVDHCGHSLGPYHPAMGKKLIQLNSVIKSVLRALDDDTMLFVLGDHGMTRTGDHGGDSLEERSATLFMHSSKKFITKTDLMEKTVPESISQIDFVPTLSLLLGVPIPFSSLGAIIPPIFSLLGPTLSPSSNQEQIAGLSGVQVQRYRRIFAYRSNAQQIHQYITTYNEVARDFPTEVYSLLETYYQKAEEQFRRIDELINPNAASEITSEMLQEAEDQYRMYVTEVREMCRSIWAKFEMIFVYQGLTLAVLAVFISAVLVTVQHYAQIEQMNDLLQSLMKQVASWIVCAVVVGALLSQSDVVSSVTGYIFIPSLTSITVMTIHLWSEVSSVNASKLFRTVTLRSVMQYAMVLAPIFLHSVLLASDSHVINEGKAIIFFTQSVIVFFIAVFSVQTYESFYTDKPNMRTTFRVKKLMTSPAARIILFGVASLVCVRICALFVTCREEHYWWQWCTESGFNTPLSLLPEQSNFRSYRYFISIGSIAVFSTLLIYHLTQLGNLSASSGQVYAVRYMLPLASICMCMYWGQQALPEKLRELSPTWQRVVFPQIAYAMIALAALLQWIFPLNLLLVKRPSIPKPNSNIHHHGNRETSTGDELKPSGDASDDQTVPESSQTVESADMLEEQPPLVYGLGTVFSSVYLHILVSLALFIALIHSDGLALSVLLMAAQTIFFLEIYSATRRKQLTPLSAMPELYKMGFFSVPWYVVGVWSLMATQYFFATGHQATFTAIRFESAYVGFDGDFPRYLYFIPAALVTFNTFSSQIFFAALLPLILIWPFTRGLWVTGNRVISEDEQQGELNLHTKSSEAVRAVFQICIMYLVFQACDLIGTMVAATILRRHLMAWRVFAPRFIFQGVGFGATIVTVLATFLFFSHIQRRLARWINRIPS